MRKPLTIQMKYDDYENLIVTAIEGGINYWATVDLKVLPKKDREVPLSIHIAKCTWQDPDLKIPVYDTEGDMEEPEGYFSYNNLMENAHKAPWALGEFLTEQYDAGSADALFQVACFDEVVFG